MAEPSATTDSDAITIYLKESGRAQPTQWERLDQRLKILSSVVLMLSSVAVPVVIAIIGSGVQQRLQEQAVRRDYVTLAVSILRDPSDKIPSEMKSWAADLLDANAPIKLPPQLKASLQSGKVLLPSALVSGSIGVSPDTIRPGEKTTISWNSFNATSVTITPDIGAVASSGSVQVSPKSTTTYTLNLSNGSSTTTGTATVHVIPATRQ